MKTLHALRACLLAFSWIVVREDVQRGTLPTPNAQLPNALPHTLCVPSVTMLSAEPDPAPFGEKRQPFIVSKAALSMVTAGMLPRATACKLMSHPVITMVEFW